MEFDITLWLLMGFYIILFISLLSIPVFGAIMFIRKIIRLRKSQNPKLTKYYVLILICVALAGISWLFNFGWIRVFLTWVPLPLAYSALFAILCYKSIPMLDLSKKLKIYMIVSYITYIGTFFLLPDGGDQGPAYLFFGLIRNHALFRPALTLSVICFILNIVFLILMLVERNKAKEQQKINAFGAK